MNPTSVERRAATAEAATHPAPVERRRRRESRVRMPVELRSGWLAFECKSERRRLAPVPHGWLEMSEEELGELLGRAELKAKPRRLIE